MDVTVEIKGLQEAEARLQEIGALAGQKLLRRVLRKIAKPMHRQAQAGAQSVARSGALAASIQIYNKRPQGAEVARIAVGSVAKNRTAVHVHNAAYDRNRKGIYYGWMLEKGHRIGTRKTGWLRKRSGKSGGTAAGSVAGRPWFEPAVRATEGPAVRSFVDELARALDRIEKRKTKTANPESVVTE